MKKIAAVVTGLLIAAPMAARAHIAVQPKYEAQFLCGLIVIKVRF